MKKSLLTILAVSFSFVVFGQVLLSDFDGNQMSGIVIQCRLVKQRYISA